MYAFPFSSLVAVEVLLRKVYFKTKCHYYDLFVQLRMRIIARGESGVK